MFLLEITIVRKAGIVFAYRDPVICKSQDWNIDPVAMSPKHWNDEAKILTP